MSLYSGCFLNRNLQIWHSLEVEVLQVILFPLCLVHPVAQCSSCCLISFNKQNFTFPVKPWIFLQKSPAKVLNAKIPSSHPRCVKGHDRQVQTRADTHLMRTGIITSCSLAEAQPQESVTDLVFPWLGSSSCH